MRGRVSVQALVLERARTGTALVLEQCDAFALSQRKRCQCNAYRAPGSPIAAFGVESVIDELGAELDIDPIEFRLMNAAREGTRARRSAASAARRRFVPPRAIPTLGSKGTVDRPRHCLRRLDERRRRIERADQCQRGRHQSRIVRSRGSRCAGIGSPMTMLEKSGCR
ncbi:MAG: molybdopterin-dependent oxidoreductase [Gammaproteobacteria bacterium]|nr:molybdopterin-dependent oxidoreductase [Gammaproteobacteria bacterium]